MDYPADRAAAGSALLSAIALMEANQRGDQEAARVLRDDPDLAWGLEALCCTLAVALRTAVENWPEEDRRDLDVVADVAACLRRIA